MKRVTPKIVLYFIFFITLWLSVMPLPVIGSNFKNVYIPTRDITTIDINTDEFFYNFNRGMGGLELGISVPKFFNVFTLTNDVWPVSTKTRDFLRFAFNLIRDTQIAFNNRMFNTVKNGLFFFNSNNEDVTPIRLCLGGVGLPLSKNNFIKCHTQGVTKHTNACSGIDSIAENTSCYINRRK